jgi:hypothetical protein
MANKAFDSEIFKDHQDYWQVAQNIKDIYLSEGTLMTLLDFERVLDSMDLYAFKNWDIGELVQGPTVGKYHVSCIFLWPENLMPDPRGAKRLAGVGCKIKFKKTKIKVPVQVENPDDYIPGTRYPKTAMREVWLIYIEMPKELMDDIREGSVDLAGQNIDLNELDDAYDDDLDKEDTGEEDDQEQDQMDQTGTAAPSMGMPPPLPAM